MDGAIRNPVDAADAIQGWMSREELSWLSGMVSSAKSVIEIGAHRGRTTKLLSGSMQSGVLVAVDIWKHPGMLDEVRKNLSAEIAEGRVKIVHGSSIEQSVVDLVSASIPQGCAADAVFLDSDHDYEHVKAEIEIYRKLLRPGGLLAGHDAFNRDYPGVLRALFEAFPATFRMGAGSIWYVTP